MPESGGERIWESIGGLLLWQQNKKRDTDGNDLYTSSRENQDEFLIGQKGIPWEEAMLDFLTWILFSKGCLEGCDTSNRKLLGKICKWPGKQDPHSLGEIFHENKGLHWNITYLSTEASMRTKICPQCSGKSLTTKSPHKEPRFVMCLISVAWFHSSQLPPRLTSNYQYDITERGVGKKMYSRTPK